MLTSYLISIRILGLSHPSLTPSCTVEDQEMSRTSCRMGLNGVWLGLGNLGWSPHSTMKLTVWLWPPSFFLYRSSLPCGDKIKGDVPLDSLEERQEIKAINEDELKIQSSDLKFLEYSEARRNLKRHCKRIQLCYCTSDCFPLFLLPSCSCVVLL